MGTHSADVDETLAGAASARWDWDGQPEEEHRERETLRRQVAQLGERAAELERQLVAERRRSGDLARALTDLSASRLWRRRAVLRSIRIQGLLRQG